MNSCNSTALSGMHIAFDNIEHRLRFQFSKRDRTSDESNISYSTFAGKNNLNLFVCALLLYSCNRITIVCATYEQMSTNLSLWLSGIGSRLWRNRLWVRFPAVSDIFPMFTEPTITWVPLGFSGHIWLDTKIVLKTNCVRMCLLRFEMLIMRLSWSFEAWTSLKAKNNVEPLAPCCEPQYRCVVATLTILL